MNGESGKLSPFAMGPSVGQRDWSLKTVAFRSIIGITTGTCTKILHLWPQPGRISAVAMLKSEKLGDCDLLCLKGEGSGALGTQPVTVTPKPFDSWTDYVAYV